MPVQNIFFCISNNYLYSSQKTAMSEEEQIIQDYMVNFPYNHFNTLSFLDTDEILVTKRNF